MGWPEFHCSYARAGVANHSTLVSENGVGVTKPAFEKSRKSKKSKNTAVSLKNHSSLETSSIGDQRVQYDRWATGPYPQTENAGNGALE